MSVNELIQALMEFYGDKSRTREETLDGLKEVRDELNLLIDSLGD